MGSTYTTMPGQTIKGFAGREYPVPMYMQFVPGHCIEVVHSVESLRFNGPNSINSIIALPHLSEDVGKQRANSGEEFRYYPLLRGMSDIPSKGDPVLLCTIGRINYYLGPLNTSNNSPTWNDDINFKSDPVFSSGGLDSDLGEVSPRGERGESKNFNKERAYSRLIKIRKKGLDYGNALYETTGDTIIEGRHGNSLRIGSRSNNPYLIISNKRNPASNVESILDGSIISVTSNGSIAHHLGNIVSKPFQLSSDKLTSPVNTIGALWSNLNSQESDEIYLYGSKKTDEIDENENPIYKGEKANQILLHSDRITLNTKLDDIFISSKKDIHIGAGRHLTFTTSGGPDVNDTNSIIFQSSNVNIGNHVNMESMVLGEQLKKVLTKIVGLFDKIKIASSGQPAGIQSDPTYQVGVGEEIGTLITEIDNITSTKHFIEPNT